MRPDPAVPRRLTRLPTAVLADGRAVHVAAGPRARLLGLAMLDRPGPPCALLLPRTRSVHTAGMRFALDLLWLDRRGAVVRVDRGVPAWRVRTCRAARAVVEVPAGGPASELLNGT